MTFAETSVDCLDGLAAFLPEGAGLPRLAVRTGDTPGPERQAFRHDPPEVLLTTPESLAVLLSQSALLPLFAGLRWVVVDEVHALAPTKRGADLALSLERLSAVASSLAAHRPVRHRGAAGRGRALPDGDGSALCHRGSVRGVAAGPARRAAGRRPGLRRRPDSPADPRAAPVPRHADLRQHAPTGRTPGLGAAPAAAGLGRSDRGPPFVGGGGPAARGGSARSSTAGCAWWSAAPAWNSASTSARSISSRWCIRPAASCGCCSASAGRATGRAECGAGWCSRHSAAELLEAVVTGASGRAAQCEPLQSAVAPAGRALPADRRHGRGGNVVGRRAVRLGPAVLPLSRSDKRSDFDDCLAYLRGLDRDGRPWLPPRLRGDAGRPFDPRRAHGTPAAPQPRHDPGGGAGDLSWRRLAATRRGARKPSWSEIGDVDQAFADRLQPGDRFLLDGRCLEFRRREGATLFVDEVSGRPATPRWGGDGWAASTELARRLFLLRVQAAEALRDGPAALAEMLRRDYARGRRGGRPVAGLLPAAGKRQRDPGRGTPC